MEIWQIFGLGLVVGLFVVCFFVVCLYALLLFRERQEFENRLEKVRMEALSKNGVAARDTYSQRRQAAIMEVANLLNAEGEKPNIKDVLLKVAAKYPDVAAQAAQNPSIMLKEIKKMGLSLPPELLSEFKIEDIGKS